MKCTFSFNQSITIYLIIVLLNKFLECQNIHEKRVPLEEEFVIHENRSHRYSFRFGYLQKISLNQSHPVVNGSFHKFTGTQSFTPKFPFKYFDTEVKRFDFYSTGTSKTFSERKHLLIPSSHVISRLKVTSISPMNKFYASCNRRNFFRYLLLINLSKILCHTANHI
ncbi:unnamed protein product [Schistosoma bovis]|nr:unnamed protein product [Schistosoma bovis]